MDGRTRGLIVVQEKSGTVSDLSQRQKWMTAMSAKPRVRLSDDERKKFDSIGLDDINAIVDVAELHKLHRYME